MALLFQKIAQGKAVNAMSEIGFMKAKSGLKSGSKDTRDWFRTKAASVAKLSPQTILKHGGRSVKNFQGTDIGRMFMFLYDPKFKDELPYYDRFPLIFVVNGDKNGFLGINLHYLPPVIRAKLMDALYSTINNKMFDQTTRLRLSYEILQKSTRMRWFKPCVKRYLYSHVRSNIVQVDAEDWDYVALLPLERFAKAKKENVQSDSMLTFTR